MGRTDDSSALGGGSALNCQAAYAKGALPLSF